MLTVQSTVHDRCGGVSLEDLKGVYCLSQNVLVLAGCSHHSGVAALKTAAQPKLWCQVFWRGTALSAPQMRNYTENLCFSMFKNDLLFTLC